MWDSIRYAALVVAGLILVVDASHYAGAAKARSQLVQLPRWAHVALGVTITVLAAISLDFSSGGSPSAAMDDGERAAQVRHVDGSIDGRAAATDAPGARSDAA